MEHGIEQKKREAEAEESWLLQEPFFLCVRFSKSISEKKKEKKKVNLIFASFSHCRNQEQVWIFQFVCTSSPHFNEQHGLSLSFFFSS